ncbi:MAG: T9SS type A sorting domain-containing protein [Candidatus Marinimicrobia bacterium]|nr:T9SS type A sorting domain-containing protein [Candidatus Neomarinimicrobiota bacterium]
MRYAIIKLVLLCLIPFSLSSSLQAQDVLFFTMGSDIFSGVGDQNSDGYDDILVVRPNYSNTWYLELYLGGSPMDTIPADTIEFDTTLYYRIDWILPLGDINGDGVKDFAINHNLDATAFYAGGWPPQHVGTKETYSVSYYDVGDVNADGYDDFISKGVSWQGNTFYLFYGNADFDLVPDDSLVYPTEYLNAQGIPTGGQDFTGDGIDDFILVYKFNSSMVPDSPFVYFDFFEGGVTFEMFPTYTATYYDSTNAVADHNFVGDMNGDGISEWALWQRQTDPEWPELGDSNGSPSIHLGGSQLNQPAYYKLDSPPGATEVRPFYAGDFNGDGYADAFAVENIEFGNISIFLGGPNFDRHYDLLLSGNWTWQEWFGRRSRWCGDVNGDGCDDILTGAESLAGAMPYIWIIGGDSTLITNNYPYLDSWTPEDSLLIHAPGDTLYFTAQGHDIDEGDYWAYGWFINGEQEAAGDEDSTFTLYLDPDLYHQGNRYQIELAVADEEGYNQNFIWELQIDSTVGIARNPELPLSFQLSAYPNPFNNQTQIEFQLPQKDHIQLNVYDLKGRLVRVLASGNYELGVHRIGWDTLDGYGKPMVSGLHFIRLTTRTGQHRTIKLSYLK